MKKLIVLLFLFAFTAASFSQGLFRPVQQDIFKSQLSAAKSLKSTSVWIPRISAGVVANQFTYDPATKQLNMSSFSKVGLGLSYAHFVPVNELPYNNYSVNAFVFFPTTEPESGLSLALTFSTLRFINIGAGYDFGVKKIFALTGIAYTF